nr:MAG TPA_asm: hypothetical protein [Caudoviricetes sp.]
MTAVTITLSFASEAEAAAYLAGKAGTTVVAETKTEKKVEKSAETKTEKKVEKAPEGPSADEVTALMGQVKDKYGAPVAKQIIADCGYAKLAELVQDAAARTKAAAACKAKLEATDDEM